MATRATENYLKVDHVRRRSDAVWIGVYDLAAVAASCKRRTEEGAHGYAQLIDGRSAEIARSAEDARDLPRAVGRLVNRSVEAGQAGPTAVVVSKSIDFGMCRMIAAHFEPAGKIEVFYTPEEAEAWLAAAGT